MIKGHGGRFACYACEGPCTFQCGQMRPSGLLKQRLAQFLQNGGKLKDAKQFANVIKRCLLEFPEDAVILFLIPPPPLHLLMGATNAIMWVIIQIKGIVHNFQFVQSFRKIAMQWNFFTCFHLCVGVA